MRITCDHCQAKYTIADEKVQGRTVKIRCRKCSGDIVVHGAPSTNETNPSYQVGVGDTDERTMSLTEVLAALASGLINEDTFVWADGFQDWKVIRDVPAIMSQLPERESESIAVTEDGADAPRAAVVKRDHERSTRDLFGNPLEVEAAAPRSVPPENVPKPAPAADAMTLGQRGENSVLFSLATLGPSIEKGKSAPPPPVAPKADDSGVIDIKALLPSSSEPRAMAAAIPSALFGPPVLEPAPSAEDDTKPAKSKLPLVAGAAAVMLALGGLGLWMQSKKAAEAPVVAVAPVTTASTASATAAVEPPPAPPPPPATASAAPPPPPPADSATKAAAKPAGGHAHAAPAGAKSGPKSPPPAAAKPAKAGGCAKCAGDDLMCQIRCSAGK